MTLRPLAMVQKPHFCQPPNVWAETDYLDGRHFVCSCGEHWAWDAYNHAWVKKWPSDQPEGREGLNE